MNCRLSPLTGTACHGFHFEVHLIRPCLSVFRDRNVCRRLFPRGQHLRNLDTRSPSRWKFVSHKRKDPVTRRIELKSSNRFQTDLSITAVIGRGSPVHYRTLALANSIEVPWKGTKDFRQSTPAPLSLSLLFLLRFLLPPSRLPQFFSFIVPSPSPSSPFCIYNSLFYIYLLAF